LLLLHAFENCTSQKSKYKLLILKSASYNLFHSLSTSGLDWQIPIIVSVSQRVPANVVLNIDSKIARANIIFVAFINVKN